MSSLHQRLRAVGRLSARSCRAALLCALEASDPGESDAILAEILERLPQDPIETLMRILASWTALSMEGQRAALSATGGAGRGLAALLNALHSSQRLLDRRSALRIEHDLLTGTLTVPEGAGLTLPWPVRAATLDAAASALQAQDPVAAATARRVVTQAAMQVNPSDLAASTPGEVRRSLDQALTLAATGFAEHRDERVLRAVLRWASRPGPRLTYWLSAQGDPAHPRLRAIAKAMPAQDIDRDLLAWLALPALESVARSVLEADHALTELPQTLAQFPLLSAMRRERPFRMLASLEHSLPTTDQVAALPDEARLGLMHWSAFIHRDLQRRRTSPTKSSGALNCLANSTFDPSPRVRFAGARAAAALPANPALDELMLEQALDQDESVARCAIHALTSPQSPARRAALMPSIDRLTRSPHASVRASAVRAQIHDPFTSPIAARRMLDRAPDTLRDALHDRLADPSHAVGALSLIRRLGIAPWFREQLLELLVQSDPRTTASSALLLARATSSADAQAARALAALLAHDDDRVRANAVEALGELCPDRVGLHAFTSDDTPRVRGNAVRHAVHHLGFTEPLVTMLRDSRMPHRRSALWVVWRTRPESAASSIAQLAANEPDPTLRAKARETARRLLMEIEHKPTPAPPAPQGALGV